MNKKELIKLLRDLPNDAVIGFRPHDLGEDQPAESFSTGFVLEEDDFARVEQGFDFIFI